MSQADYDNETFLVQRRLIESAIDALTEQAQRAELWRGRRDGRIDIPLADAAELRAIVGEYAPVLSAEEAAARGER